MTKLYFYKHKVKKRNNNRLESLFYHSSDIKHMRQEKNTIEKTICYYIKMFEILKEDIL